MGVAIVVEGYGALFSKVLSSPIATVDGERANCEIVGKVM